MLSLSYQIDSLEQEINGRDLYLKSLQDVINGGVTTTDKIKDEQKTDTATSTQVTQVSLDHLSADELEIRKEFEDDDYSEPYSSNLNYGTLSQINFFTPVNGVITAKFDQKMLHYGVDIVAKTGSTIQAVAVGKVIMADWTKESGNVIIIQHKGSLISVYKHNSSLMKKVGSFVKAGEAIAVIGNSGELTTGPHLHLELWLGGNPINPQRYIPFE
jgi:murein DD-endopeptidase MepM/ murein hydrolase activator NlpD